MAVPIDTSSLIEAERGRLNLEPHVLRRSDEVSFLSVITVSELLHGVHRTTQLEQRMKRSAFVEGIFEWFAILEIDVLTARTDDGHG